VLNTLVLSYHTGLPSVCANLSRTSIEESKKIIQIVTPNYYEKKIVNDFTSKKPFLIVKTGNSFSQYEKAIIEKAVSIYKNDEFELMQISIDKLFSDDKSKMLNSFHEKSPSLIHQDDFLVSSKSSVLYYNSFEKETSAHSFRGKSCFESNKKGKNTFAEFPPNTFLKGVKYDLNIWMFNGEPDALNLWFRLIVEEFDEANQKWHTTTIFPEQAEVINGNWSLVEGVFTVKNSKNKVFITTKGKMNSKANLHVDDLLIKETGIDVYKMDSLDNSLFFNNHKIKLPN